jgi:hypothetical protein
MQLEVSVEELRKYKLFVATPMYGGMNHGMYMKSCLDLQAICSQYGIEVRFSFIFNESLITRARNYLVDEFLRAEGFTHLLFIDADIHFDPRDVVACLALDKDVVGGPYPKKSIKWGAIKEAVKKHPEIATTELEKLAGDFVFNPVPGTEKFSVAEPVEVLEIGTGFMMVKREVFDKFKEAYPEFSYRPDHVGQANFDGQRYIHAYFDTVIDRKRKVMVNGEEREFGGSDRYLSEDYMFCQWWRNIGGKIWLCPWMKTHHIGTYAFTGDMPAVANFVGSL